MEKLSGKAMNERLLFLTKELHAQKQCDKMARS